MAPILETDRDRQIEELVMRRVIEELKVQARAIRLPRLSAIDFVLEYEDGIRFGIEIKSRKESADQVRAYGGLMLKHRKLLEMQELARLLAMDTFVIFAFENGGGGIFACDTMKIRDVTPKTPPVRRNYRGLACDEEPVIYLDWEADLQRLR